MTKRLINFFLGVLIVATAGCAETRYVPYQEGKGNNETIPFAREVASEIDREFYMDMPDCAVVLPPSVKEAQQHYARLVEWELTRRLRGKISRVVGPTQRRISARELALAPGLDGPGDLRLLAEKLGCETIVFSEVEGGPTNLLVWSQVSMAIDIRMERASDGKILWRAKTEATRSDGGLPLSPLSIFTNGFNSALFAADETDVTASVVADAVRRIFQKFPDARRFDSELDDGRIESESRLK